MIFSHDTLDDCINILILTSLYITFKEVIIVYALKMNK